MGKSAKVIPFKGFPNEWDHVTKLTKTHKFLVYKGLSQAGLWSHLFEAYSVLQSIEHFFVAELIHLLNMLTLT